ncbi:hypothetical protein [Thermoplasma acidophilum]|uniref:hypothetical protein n=1 Tax=Thermoplasma acidophilum TaxID=2303 RepID=UPI00001660E9|nr:hypothetical protein [Thermoplasma acidophilum]MCY0852398.1 hypothetical protein [Thermoplasma acidophilum]
MADTLDKAIDDTILQIKALMLIAGNDRSSQARIRKRLSESRDQSVMEFRQIVGQETPGREYLYAAIGEFIISSFLILLSAIIMTPALASFVNADLVSRYLDGIAVNIVALNAIGYAEVIGMLLLAFFILFLGLHTIRLGAEKTARMW